MPPRNNCILLVEQDQKIIDLLYRQILKSLGYQVELVGSVAEAIREASSDVYDVVITNLDLSGLSGNDLLVAFTAQNIRIPVIVLAKKGVEHNVIKAFRLGAADYLNLPVRETEVVAVVERVLNQIHAQRERERLINELKQTNVELQQYVNGLVTTLMIGKSITSINDLDGLYEIILEAAISVTDADRGWILMRKDRGKKFLVTAHQNTYNNSIAQIQILEEGNHSLEDIIEAIQPIEDEEYRNIRLSKSGKPTIVASILSHKMLIGLLVMMRSDPNPFSSNEQTLLEAIANYASLSITKLRLFQAVRGQVRGTKIGRTTTKDADPVTD